MPKRKSSSKSVNLAGNAHHLVPSAIGGAVAWLFTASLVLGLIVFVAVWVGHWAGHALSRR